MSLEVIGLNHKGARIASREDYLDLCRNQKAGILLATCNRVEVYGWRKRSVGPQFSGRVYCYSHQAALKHLFRVAAGLDSQVIGETEILGQMKRLYHSLPPQNKVFKKIFREALEVGRLVRVKTALSRGNVSVASVAAGFAKNTLGKCRSKKTVLIGSGKVAESLLKNLIKEGFSPVLIANRTFARASEIALSLGQKAFRFENLKEQILNSDLVISSTAAPHYVLKTKDIGLRKKPLLVIDLAVPRDVDPAVGELAGVKLFGIDDIEEARDRNLKERQSEALKAEKIVEAEVKRRWKRLLLQAAAVN